MAESSMGGLAEGLIAGFTVVSQARARHANIAMQREELKLKKHQSDMADMNYFVNMLNANVPEDMKKKSFENIKGIMQGNEEYFGIPKGYDYDKMKYESGDKVQQEVFKKLQAINVQSKKVDKDGNPVMTQADANLALRGVLLEYNEYQQSKVKPMVEKYGEAMKADDIRKRAERMQKLGWVTQHAEAVSVDKEGRVSTKPAPTYKEKSEQDLESAKELAKFKYDLTREDQGELVTEREKFQAQQEKEVRDLIHKNYGFEKDIGFPDEETAAKARQVMVDATAMLRGKTFTDPKTGELRKPTIAEAFKSADAAYKKTAARAEIKKLPLADDGRWLNNVKSTINKMGKAVSAGDLSPQETLEYVRQLGWKDEKLVEVITGAHPRMREVWSELQDTFKEDNVKTDWYSTPDMPGVEFYWDQKSGQVTNMRNTKKSQTQETQR